MGSTKPGLRFTLCVLLSINAMNFFDRQVPGAVAESLRRELHLSDAQNGWLTPAFLVLYALIGIPLGRWADIGRRTHILAIGVLLWSGMTALSGLAWNFWSLFVLRLGVGVGEASCAPAANSLLGDLVPRQRRGWAISVFMLGLPLGLGLSFIVSGNVAHVWGWRAAFFVAGLPGLVLAVLCLRIPEPARGAVEEHTIGAARRQGPPLLLVLRIPTMWWIILSGALHNFNMYAIGTFLSMYLQRYHHLHEGQAGLISGVVSGCLGGTGILLGGWASDRIGAHRISGRLEVSTLALAISTPCIFLALEQPQNSPWAFAAWILPGCMLGYVYYSGVYSTIPDIVEPSLRGTAMATYFFAMYLLGGALGPVIIGSISDHIAREAALTVSAEQARAIGLHHALYLIPALGALLVVVLFVASRTVRKDYEKLQKWITTDTAATAIARHP